MFVSADFPHLALASGRYGDRHDFSIEEAITQRRLIARLRKRCIGVGVFAAYLHLRGKVVGSLGHAVVAVLGNQPAIGKAHADGAVEKIHGAAERGRRFVHDERRPGHALDAARQIQAAFTTGDRPGRVDHRRQPTGTQAIDGNARHRARQVGQQRGMARDVAAVFAALVGAAEDDFVERTNGKAGGLHDLRQHRCGKVVWAQWRKAAGMAAERAAQPGIDIGIEHAVVSAKAVSGAWSEAPLHGRRDGWFTGPGSRRWPAGWQSPRHRSRGSPALRGCARPAVVAHGETPGVYATA